MRQNQLPQPEYICTIPEIAEFLGIADRVIREKATNFNWQPTGERVQGGGDKYNISQIRFYKSDDRHHAAVETIKIKLKWRKDQADLAAAAALKDRLKAETLVTIYKEIPESKRFLPEEATKHEAELRAKREALANLEGNDKSEQALVLLAMTTEKGKQAGTAKAWLLDQIPGYLARNSFSSKHKEKNPGGWNEKGLAAFCRDFVAGEIAIPEEYKPFFTRKGKLSLTIPAIRGWKKNHDELGIYGVARKHKERRGATKIPPQQQEVIYSLVYEFPHIKAAQIREALLARFSGEYIVHEDTIFNFVRYWKAENPSRFLLLSNPDKHRNKYQFAVGKADADITRLNQVWEADSTPADVLCTDGRCCIIGIIDLWPRRVKFLASPTSKGTAIAALKRRCLLDWGTPEELHTDNGTDYTGNYIEAVCERLNIYHHVCPPFTPEAKPFIERVFKTLSHGLMELLPGFVGHSVKERKDIESRKTFAKRLMTPGETIEANMTIAELQSFLDNWTTIYHNRRHSSLKMSPVAKVRTWTEPVRRISNERALDILLQESVFRTVSKKGIAVTFKGASMQYVAGEFIGWEGKQVEVKIDETDLGHAVIFSDSRKFICVAQDPAMTGISLQEVAEQMKRKQKEGAAEFRKEMKQISKKANTKNIVQEIIKHRLDQTAKVAEFPKKAEEYGTESLSEAATAVTEIGLKNAEPKGPALTAEQIRNSDELLNKRIPERPKTMLDICIEYERKIKAGNAAAHEIEYVEAYHIYEETGRRTGPLALRALA